VSKLPVVSARRTIAALGRIGYEIDHQTGGHIILRRPEPPHRRLSIPNHRELAKGTLRSIVREAGLTVDEFLSLL